MKQLNENKEIEPNGTETSQHRRAFRKAMSKSLKETFRPTTDSAMPKEFMALLAEADRKRN